jgi:hypothetical protein
MKKRQEAIRRLIKLCRKGTPLPIDKVQAARQGRREQTRTIIW